MASASKQTIDIEIAISFLVFMFTPSFTGIRLGTPSELPCLAINLRHVVAGRVEAAAQVNVSEFIQGEVLEAGRHGFSNVELEILVERFHFVLPTGRQLLHLAAKLRKLVIGKARV